MVSNSNKKRALVVGIGGMRGAYDVGVVNELFKNLGRNYFDSVYAASAGVFISTYFVAGYPERGEKIWREDLDGKKFIRLTNPFRKRNIIDLEYLAEVSRREETKLPIEELIKTKISLVYVVTDKETLRPFYINPNPNSLYMTMIGSAAIPKLHPSVVLGDLESIDGGISDPLPIEKALEDGHDEVIVVYNKPPGLTRGNKYERAINLFASRTSPRFRAILQNLHAQLDKKERLLSREDNRIKIIRPKKQLPIRHIFDTNKERIHATIELGKRDARDFLERYFH